MRMRPSSFLILRARRANLDFLTSAFLNAALTLYVKGRVFLSAYRLSLSRISHLLLLRDPAALPGEQPMRCADATHFQST